MNEERAYMNKESKDLFHEIVKNEGLLVVAKRVLLDKDDVDAAKAMISKVCEFFNSYLKKDPKFAGIILEKLLAVKNDDKINNKSVEGIFLTFIEDRESKSYAETFQEALKIRSEMFEKMINAFTIANKITSPDFNFHYISSEVWTDEKYDREVELMGKENALLSTNFKDSKVLTRKEVMEFEEGLKLFNDLFLYL